MSEHSEIDPVTYARETLGKGQAVDITLEIARKPKRLILVPSTCWGAQKQELLIALEGHASIIWDGVRALNQFVLITGGLPIFVASEVANFLLAVMQSEASITLPPSVATPLALMSRKPKPSKKKRKL